MSSKRRNIACAMGATMRAVKAVLTGLAVVVVVAAVYAQPPNPPGMTPEEMQLYGAFRTWITSQPPEVHNASDDEVWARYSAELRSHGKSEADAAATVASLKRIGDKAEV